MARKNALARLLTGRRPAHAGALQKHGWRRRDVYRARADSSSLPPSDGPCRECGETHRNPYEGDPHYVTPRVPTRVATHWARHHGIVAHVETRAAYVHKKTRTQVDRVQLVPYTDWETLRVIRP